MALILKKLCIKKDLNICKALTSFVVNRGKGHWFPQYKPGPYPKTKEERELAAKKYNLLPEEYEPYPDDGSGLGDYPKLPLESVDERDPWYPWDDPHFRRDYLEPLHDQIIVLQPEVYSRAEDKLSTKNAIKYFILINSAVFLLMYGFYQLETHPRVLEKQTIKSGKVHYTFELDPERPPPKASGIEKEEEEEKTKLRLPLYFTFRKDLLRF